MGDDDGQRSLDALLREIARAPDAAVPSSLVGETLGRYRLDALLGRGGMGVVYRARDTKLDRDVALKLLPPELVGDAERRARFVREAKLAAQVTHPCVAAVYDVGEQDEAVFLAMELVTGRTLRSVLDEHPKGMPAGDVARIGADLARGLAKAHEAGIVHRDLKPENVMLDDEGHPKILDFGLAKLREVGGADPETLSTELGRVLGTPSYMSPEQAKGKPVDPRSDVFSLGIVLYEMLAAKRPFVGETTMEVLIAIDRDVPPPLASAREGLPKKLVDIVDRCLAKGAADRPDARDVAGKLRELATRDVMTLPPPRSRRRAYGLAAIALVAAAGIAMPLSRRVRQGPGASPAASAPSLDTLLPREGAALACPPLEGIEDGAPAGWLGAAAANLVCRKATVVLGGRNASTLVPAELASLPRAPAEDLPVDAYADPKTRERALASAKTRAATWLDGRIEGSPDGYRVDLVLRSAAGTELARGHADDPTIHRATLRALDGLTLPERPLDDAYARWTLFPNSKIAILAVDNEIYTRVGAKEGRDALAPFASEVGPFWSAIAVDAARVFGEPRPDVAPPALDRSSIERLAITAMTRKATAGDVPVSVADELHAAAESAKDPWARARMRIAEAAVRDSPGESDKNREAMLAVIQEQPREEDAWQRLSGAAYGHPGYLAVAKAYAAWAPEDPDAWNIIGYSLPPKDPDAFRYQARAVAIALDVPLFAQNYASGLLDQGRFATARALAARLLQRPTRTRLSGQAMLAVVDAAEGRFAGALDRAHTLVDVLPNLGEIESGTDVFLFDLFAVEAVVTGQTTLADAIAERFVLAEPTRVSHGNFAAVDALVVCGWVRAELFGRCVTRVHSLVDAGWFNEGTIAATKPFLTGLEHLANGKAKLAADSFRNGVLGSYRYAQTPRTLEAFEKSGDDATLAVIDEKLRSKRLAGVSYYDVHAARWAWRKGDKAKAKALAQKIVDAWAIADTKMVALDEMRAILK